MLQRLLYRSECGLPGTAQEIALKVGEIVAAAAAANKATGVTGALMLTSGVFIQTLEGFPAAVEATFERICGDLRHRHVRLLELAVADERLFSEWSMVEVTPTRELAALSPTVGHLNTQLDASAATAAIQVMRTLLLTQNPRQAGRAGTIGTANRAP